MNKGRSVFRLVFGMMRDAAFIAELAEVPPPWGRSAAVAWAAISDLLAS